jgi:deoxyinosine 3'endonuclease (endonuclease V)
LFKKLKLNKPEYWPQLVLVDGNGILHQNMFGLACHLGVLIDIPTVGCGKTLFYVDGLSKAYVYQTCDDNLFKAGDSVPLVGKSKK